VTKKAQNEQLSRARNNNKTNVLNCQGEDGTSGQVGSVWTTWQETCPLKTGAYGRAEGIFLDCNLTFSGKIR